MTPAVSTGRDAPSDELDDALPHGIPEDILAEALEEGTTGGDLPDPDRSDG